MRIGIVGNEAAKFTNSGALRACDAIRQLVQPLVGVEHSAVVSGACHLGGVDIWARDIARWLGVPMIEFPPASQSWEHGYKPRNLQIAEASDFVFCLAVDRLPHGFSGMRFKRCYHCNRVDHVKSGGCWTVLQAQRLGKRGAIVVIPNG